MTHSEIRESLGAYALNALEPDEMVAVHAHLSTCSACKNEARALEDVQNTLAFLVEEMEPPPALRTRLMNVVDRERDQWLAGQRPGATALSAREQTRAKAGLLSHLRDWWRRSPAIAAGGALAVVVVVVLAVLLVNRNSVTVTHTYACSVATPSLDGGNFAAAGCSVSVRSDNTIELAFNSLPALNASQSYELWALPAKGNPVPVAGFAAGSTGAFQHIYSIDAARYAKAAITVEKAPGNSPAPHGPIVFVLPL